MRKKTANIVLILLLGISFNGFSVCISDFDFQPQSPETIQFINLSSSFDEGTIHYYWDFGDGNTSFAENPDNFYSEPGIYDVTLTIITSELCYDSRTIRINVGIPPTSPYCQLDILFETQNASSPDYNDGYAYVYGFSNVPCCYYFYWSNGMEGVEIYDLEPGTYCVTLTNGEDCYGTSCVTIGYNNNCNASFYIDSTSFSHLDGAYRFANNSHGEAEYYYWEFGDGETSYQHNPLHVYEDPGTYQVCLRIQTHYNCSSLFCKEIVIGSTIPPFSNLHGYVNAGESELPLGVAVLYQFTSTGYSAIDYEIIQEGHYIFDSLSRDFLYLTHLIPDFGTDEIYFPKYNATYSGDSPYWQENSFINLHIDTIVHSQLVSYGEIYFDNGSISGDVYYNDFSAYETDVFQETWLDEIIPNENKASNIVVLLKNHDHELLDFILTNSTGHFGFKNLEYGGYYLSVEKAGMQSEEIYVEISEDNPEVSSNSFIIASNTITIGLNENSLEAKTIYPNPFTDIITIKNQDNTERHIEIYSIDGKLKDKFTSLDFEIRLDLSSYLPGIYTICIKSKDNAISQKIIKI